MDYTVQHEFPLYGAWHQARIWKTHSFARIRCGQEPTSHMNDTAFRESASVEPGRQADSNSVNACPAACIVVTIDTECDKGPNWRIRRPFSSAMSWREFPPASSPSLKGTRSNRRI